MSRRRRRATGRGPSAKRRPPVGRQPSGSRRPGLGERLSTSRLALLLAVSAFLVYYANGREAYPTGDSRPTALLPLSILYEGDLDLNEYHPPSAPVGGPIRNENGRILSNYSPLPALLSLPLYLPAWPHRAEIDGDIFRWVPFFSKLAGATFAALAVAVFFLAAAQVASRRAALLAAVALAFGGPFWMSASQTLGQHGLTVLCSSAALYALVRIERGDGWRWALAAGVACAVAAGVRLTNLVIFAAFLGYVLLHHRRLAPVFAAPALVLAAPFAALLLAILGGAGGGLQGLAFVSRIRSLFGGSLVEGVPGLLVSPGEGLFVWSPLLLLLLLPVVSAIRGAGPEAGPARPASAEQGRAAQRPAVPRRLYVFCLAVAVLLLFVYAQYVEWWGGRTYGPRYLTDALPFLLLPAAAGLERWLSERVFWATFVVLLLGAAWVQALGAFRYPCRGTNPRLLRLDQDRVWDWGASDVVLCAHSLRRPGQDLESLARLVSMTWGELVR